MAGLELEADEGCATATPVPPMAKERADIKAWGLAKAEADARHSVTASDVFTKALKEQASGFIRFFSGQIEFQH